MLSRVLYAAAVAITSILCYLNSLDGEFAYDDGAAIVKNEDVTGNTTNLTAIWIHDFWGQQLSNESSHKSYRPLTTLSFRLDYQLHNGKPRAFHVFNLGCHAVVSVLVFCLCCHVLESGRSKGDSGELKDRKDEENEVKRGRAGEERKGSREKELQDLKEEQQRRVLESVRDSSDILLSSFWCGALFGTHPVHVEAVSNIVSRSELLSSLLYLAAFFAYRSARYQRRSMLSSLLGLCAFLLSALLYTAAILCKETALTWIGVAFIYDALDILASRPAGGARSVRVLSALVRMLVLALIPAAYLWWKSELTQEHFMPKIAVIDNSAANAPTPLARALSILNTHSIYLWKLVFPLHLSCDYSRNVVPNIVALEDPANLRWMASYGVLFLLLAVGTNNAIRHRDSTLLQSLAWLAVPFGLSCNVLFPIATVVGERLLYLPSVGWCLFLASLHYRLVQTRAAWRYAVGGSVLLAVCVAYSVRTWSRNEVWRSTIDLFKAHVDIVPASVRMNHGLALEYARADQHEAALPFFDKAIRLMRDKSFSRGIRDEDEEDAHTLAQYYFEKANSLTEISKNAEALKLYDKAVALRPDRYSYQNRLAFALVQSRDYTRGFDHFVACFNLRPTEADMVNNIGNVYMATGRAELAVRTYRLAHRLAPSQTDSLYNMAVLLLRTPGKVLEGIRTLQEAIRVAPADEDLKQTLAQARRMLAQQRSL